MHRLLRVIEGPDQDRFFPLADADSLLVGSSQKNADIHLHDTSVGRIHCQVDVRDGKIVVTDLEESTGTFVNGRPVQKQELRMGDVLRIGSSQLRLEGDARFAEEDKAAGTYELPRLPVERLGELTGQPLGHFALAEQIGQSIRSAVFRAHDTKHAQDVVIKVLSPDFPSDTDELKRFSECVKLTLPVRHPNLVTVLGAGRVGPYTWLSREWAAGPSVAETIAGLAEANQGNWRWGLRVGVHVARALAHARDRRLSHRKVTPRNLLWDRGGEAVKLADLMLEESLEGSQLYEATRRRKMPEEVAYLAPEQIDEGYADELTDLFSLGVVIYALLTGRSPFEAETAAETLAMIRSAEPLPPGAINPDVPHHLEDTVMQLLARNPTDRPPGPAEVVQALEAAARRLGETV